MSLKSRQRTLFLVLTALLVPTLAPVTTFADTEERPDSVCVEILEVSAQTVTEWSEERRISALESKIKRALTAAEAKAMADALHVTLWAAGVDGFNFASLQNRTPEQTQQKLGILQRAGFSESAALTILKSGLVDYPLRAFDYGGLERRDEVSRASGLDTEGALLIERRLNFGVYRTSGGLETRPLSAAENARFKQAVARLPRFTGTCYAVATAPLVAVSVQAGQDTVLTLPQDLTCAVSEARFADGLPTNGVILEIFSMGGQSGQGRRVEEFSFDRLHRPTLFPEGSRLQVRGRYTDVRGNQRIRLMDAESIAHPPLD